MSFTPKSDTLVPISVKVSIGMIKHHDQMQLGKESVYFWLTLPHHSSSLKEVKAGTQAWNLEAGIK